MFLFTYLQVKEGSFYLWHAIYRHCATKSGQFNNEGVIL